LARQCFQTTLSTAFIVYLLLVGMNFRAHRKPAKTAAKTAEAQALEWCNKRDAPWIVEGDAGEMGEHLCSFIRNSDLGF
jgi:hypothetical protein